MEPKIISKKENSAVIEVEGLYPGYGVTIGNSLRRVLLSSLPGAVITSVKIKGASHEFSTISNVLESAVDILLNLKQIRFKLHTDEPQTATLKVKGEKKVTAADINVSSSVEVINKNAHIATLTDKKAELEMEMQISSGLGYVPVEARKKEKAEIGAIHIDAIYAPVKKVNYSVENMRVGDRTDYNKLIVHIETDGSIAPDEAFYQAAAILVDCFAVMAGPASPAGGSGKEAENKSSLKEEDEIDAAKIKIEEMKLSTRTINALTEAGIKTAGGLAKKNRRILERGGRNGWKRN